MTTAISAFYYLRIIKTMFLGPDELIMKALNHADRRPGFADAAVVTVQATLILWMGIPPQKMIGWIERLIL